MNYNEGLSVIIKEIFHLVFNFNLLTIQIKKELFQIKYESKFKHSSDLFFNNNNKKCCTVYMQKIKLSNA